MKNWKIFLLWCIAWIILANAVILLVENYKPLNDKQTYEVEYTVNGEPIAAISVSTDVMLSEAQVVKLYELMEQDMIDNNWVDKDREEQLKRSQEILEKVISENK